METFCLEQVEAAFKLAENVYKRGFWRPIVKFDLKGKSAGQAQYFNAIHLNLSLFLQHGEEFARQVVFHEVSHCVAWAVYGVKIKAHGKEWQSVMRSLGQKPERCHGMVNKSGFEYICSCRTHYVSTRLHNRIQRGENLVCKSCKGKVQWKKLLTLAAK